MSKVFAIIGGGTSGLTFLGQLVDRLIEEKDSMEGSIKIKIYEKDRENIATGLPYSSKNSDVWLLNGPPAADFRLLPDGKTLQTWMKENYDEWKHEFPTIACNDQFPPRSLVGRYFKAQYADIKEKAKNHDIIIEEIFEEVIDIKLQENSLYQVVTKNGDKSDADKIILTFGHLASDNFQHLMGKQNYIASTWDPNELKKISNDKPLYVIGAHLSFIDLAKEMVLKNNFQDKLISVTRHPSVVTMRDDGDDKCDINSISNLEEKLNKHFSNSLSWCEAKKIFWESYQQSVKQPVYPAFFEKSYMTKEALSYQLAKRAKLEVKDEYGNVDELRDFVTKFYISGAYTALWNVLTETGKEEFTKHFFSLMVAFISGIPPVNARFLIEMYEENRIEELPGLVSVDYDNETEEFVLNFENGITKRTEYLVNATGAGHDVKKHFAESPLLTNLCRSGVITPSKWSGFTVNDSNNVFAINPINYSDGKPSLSAVFLGCMSAQTWIYKTIPSKHLQLPRPRCL